jgi:hypothetical protein
MTLDPCESINNMGKLRVDVLDASDLPSADRNGYSDPYCKFYLNGKDIFKTKVQKKTLQPAWNEFFEVDIASRTASKFICNVYDWNFSESSELLGGAEINLSLLDPFRAQEYNLRLDGKSGSVRLRLIFRPDYITRSRQGSSTFSGTFATPGKIVASAPIMPARGVSLAAHGVGMGASFIKNGFKNMKRGEDDSSSSIYQNEGAAVDSDSLARRPSRSSGPPSAPTEDGASITPPGTAISALSRSRTKSFGASSLHSTAVGTPGAPTGTASFTILSATGYPPSSSVMVYLKQLGPKPKVIHKTDHIKSSSGTVSFIDKKETFKCACSADTQFQIQVKGHSTFGSDDDLGEGLLFVDDSGTGLEKIVKAGSGQVVIKSSFTPTTAENGGADSLKSGGFRKGLLSKRENGKPGRDITPTPSPST